MVAGSACGCQSVHALRWAARGRLCPATSENAVEGAKLSATHRTVRCHRAPASQAPGTLPALPTGWAACLHACSMPAVCHLGMSCNSRARSPVRAAMPTTKRNPQCKSRSLSLTSDACGVEQPAAWETFQRASWHVGSTAPRARATTRRVARPTRSHELKRREAACVAPVLGQRAPHAFVFTDASAAGHASLKAQQPLHFDRHAVLSTCGLPLPHQSMQARHCWRAHRNVRWGNAPGTPHSLGSDPTEPKGRQAGVQLT